MTEGIYVTAQLILFRAAECSQLHFVCGRIYYNYRIRELGGTIIIYGFCDAIMPILLLTDMNELIFIYLYEKITFIDLRVLDDSKIMMTRINFFFFSIKFDLKTYLKQYTRNVFDFKRLNISRILYTSF